MRLLKDTCRSIQDLLPLHVGGDLDSGPARRVDEHLHHCLSCFREFLARTCQCSLFRHQTSLFLVLSQLLKHREIF